MVRGGDDQVVISVIVPVKNGLPWLHEQLEALLGQPCTCPWEVIVADNASSDGTAEVVKEYAETHPRLHLVDASAVAGPAATRNLGVRSAGGALLAFCDADDVVHPGWVQSWVHALEKADVAAGLTDSWSLNDVPASFPHELRAPPQGFQFGFLDAAMSGNMAVSREAFEAVGGFDESLTVGEDTDLSWRLQLAGYRFVVGEGVISRRERHGTPALLRRSIQYGRCGPVLYQRFRSAGLRAEPAAALRSWLYVVATIPRLLDPNVRWHWARVAGWRIGRLIESCRRLVFFP